jgi:hypothetical protein
MHAAPALFTLALLVTGAHAKTEGTLLCNEGRTVCVSASTTDTLLTNPVKLEVQVNSPDWVQLEWEIRDDSGKRIDWNGTKGRMDWPAHNPPPQRTLHILDFILTTADSDHGTITIWATRILPSFEQRFLPTLSLPVRLTRDTSIVTTAVPEDEAEFTHEFYEWWFDTPADPKTFQTDVAFENHELEVMHFAPDALIGITAAAILTPNPCPGLWQVFGWRRVGTTAHVIIEGDGWAGVSNWLAITQYRMDRSMRLIPGIHNLKLDPPERLWNAPKAYN